MAYTYDLATGVGRVRLLIPDNRGDGSHIFEDEELQVFLEMEDDNVHRAAAEGLDVVAQSDARLYKSIEVMDVIVNAVDLAKEFRYRATELRKRGKEKEAWTTIGFDGYGPQ